MIKRTSKLDKKTTKKSLLDRAKDARQKVIDNIEETGAALSAGAADGMFNLNPLRKAEGLNSVPVRKIIKTALTDKNFTAKHLKTLIDELTAILAGNSSVEPESKDRRFADPAFQHGRIYRRVMQSYLAGCRALYNLIEDVELTEVEAERVRFTLSILTETFAPTNFFLGNPAAIKQLFKSRGASGIRGLKNLFSDWSKGISLPTQVDTKAFTVGGNLALAKGEVVFRNEVLELIQYHPTTKQVYSRPILITPPQVNKFYIMDLSPEKSVVKHLCEQGFQVFIISWRNPTKKHRKWGLEIYMSAILEAVDAVRSITGSDDVNIAAACSAGMTVSVLLAYLAAKGDKRIHAVTLLVTVIDFSVETQLGSMATPEGVKRAKKASHKKGVLEGKDMALVFALMRPNDLIWNYWVNNYLMGNSPPAFDLLFWNNDTTRLPEKLHHEILDFSVSNPLSKANALTLLGTPIDLSAVKNDIYVVSGLTDHITPWQACYSSRNLLGGTSEFILSNSGHMQSILNPPTNPKASFYRNSACPSNPEEWFEQAERVQGTWWEHWWQWLAQRSGVKKIAPKTLGNKDYPPMGSSPGSYVFEP